MISHTIEPQRSEVDVTKKTLNITSRELAKHETKIYALCSDALTECSHLEVVFAHAGTADVSFINTLCAVHMLARLTNKQLTVKGLMPETFAHVSTYIRDTRKMGCLFGICDSCYLLDLCDGRSCDG